MPVIDRLSIAIREQQVQNHMGPYDVQSKGNFIKSSTGAKKSLMKLLCLYMKGTGRIVLRLRYVAKMCFVYGGKTTPLERAT